MRPIDADALCEECRGSIIKCVGTGCRVPTMQTIEAEPVKHGRWIKPTKINGRSFSIVHCSVCGGVPCGVDENTRYCPNCGAKMDLEG